MEKFQNKYRIPSARATWWNYSRTGTYFITICTRGRRHYFGRIPPSGPPQLDFSPAGKIAHDLWHEIPNYFPYTKLGEFITMPNHIHGILALHLPAPAAASAVQSRFIASPPALNKALESEEFNHLPHGGITGTHNPMLHKNLARIIRWYKGRCSYEIRKLGIDFGWHPRFYDIIIRNDAAYERISAYIINNPAKWRTPR